MYTTRVYTCMYVSSKLQYIHVCTLCMYYQEVIHVLVCIYLFNDGHDASIHVYVINM